MMKIPFIFVLLGIFGLALNLQIPSSANLSKSDLLETLLIDHVKNETSHPSNEIRSKRLEQSITSNTAWCVNNTNGSQFLCPNTNICSPDYRFCGFINLTLCNSSAPYRCLSGRCVQNPQTQCCPTVNNITYFWCPQSNSCVQNQSACCSLNSSTPIYCQAAKTCVAHSHQCCSNYLGTNQPMVKCSWENKCVPADNSTFCFQPFNRTCSGIYGYQCPFDGSCKMSAADCASTRTCPSGYFQCPDYTCLPGSAKLANCPKLPTCISNNGTNYARCSDGVTCTDNFDKCPTQVTCPVGQVACTDNTCVKNKYQCVQPPSNTPSKLSVCGQNMIRCPNGECALSCASQNQRVNCTQSGMIQCPRTFQCAHNYDACSSDVYCPLASNYTFSQSSVVCGQGPGICTWDAAQCQSQSCFSPINYLNTSMLAQIWQGFSLNQIKSCPDGRCTAISQSCMTELSCSPGFVKAQSSGYYCHNSTTEADSLSQIAFQIQTLNCPSNMITCLTGHCRPNVYDCPQTTTCPPATPIQCQDGQCVSSKSSCATGDILVSMALKSCMNQNLILCQSDLLTCAQSQELCPTMSSCPIGFTKCSENLCVNSTICPPQQSCTIISPFYCKSQGSCVANQAACPQLTNCPVNSPVKCASDQSCQQSILKCPHFNSTATLATIATTNNQPSAQTCNPQTNFTCLNGQCQSKCSEWSKCPFSTDFQCPNGLCVANPSQCQGNNTCPFYAPFFCNYTANCVRNQSSCLNTTTAAANLLKTCNQLFGNSTQACPLGNCAYLNQSCPTVSSDQCNRYLFPNMVDQTTCFVPQCPQTLPFKCANGLCVSQKKFCPTITFAAAQINKCITISQQQNQVLVPCGDGSCAARSDLCPPLYNCSLNANLPLGSSNLTIRCNDGTCRSSYIQCPVTNSICGFRCQNGQCVDNATLCLLDNGCTAGLPVRCEQTGACIGVNDVCLSSTTVFQQFSASASKTSGVCASRNMVTCINNDIQYCASSTANCIQVDSGCPASSPLLCLGKCVSSLLNNCTQGQQPTTNNNGCPIGSPFRCSQLNVAACSALPFTTRSSLYPNTCTAKNQVLVSSFLINKCASTLTPISCADGSCVQRVGECNTCNYLCSVIMQCTANQAECQIYSQITNAVQAYAFQQQCPEGTPVRCTLTGKCVTNVLQCSIQPTFPHQTYVGHLIDLTCPVNQPVRCISGTCVNSTLFCFSPATMSSNQMLYPLQWGQNPTNNVTCQVFCADGSCRDSQQNCPLAQACLSPLAPFRCRSGFCSQSQASCIQIYGQSELETTVGTLNPQSDYCQKVMNATNNSTLLQRCEDGTCRPLVWNKTTLSYQSSCLMFSGCPLTSPFQCPTGQCVTSQTQCLQYSNLFCKGLYMCKNMRCVNDTTQCPVDQSSIPVIYQTVDVNPLVQSTIQFIFLGKQSIGNLTIPSNAINGPSQNITISQSTYSKLSISPVPNQSTYNSIVNPASLNYTNQYYNVTTQTIGAYVQYSLPFVNSLLFPMFQVSILGSNQTMFNFNATLSVMIDLPSSMDLMSDVCLAMLLSDGTINCVSRQITQVGSVISVPVQYLGLYAFVFSPDMTLKTTPVNPSPTNPPPEKQNACNNAWCTHKTLILFLSIGGSLILFILILIAVLLCLQRRKAAQSNEYNNNDKYEKLNPKVEELKKEDSLRPVKQKSEKTFDQQVFKQDSEKPVKKSSPTKQKIQLTANNEEEEERLRNEARMRKQLEKKMQRQVEEQKQQQQSEYQRSLLAKTDKKYHPTETQESTPPRTPMSLNPSVNKSQQKKDIKDMESKMREHFQKEVMRISSELQQEEKEKSSEPTTKGRYSAKSGKSLGTNLSNDTIPTDNSYPKIKSVTNKKASEDEVVNEQWESLMEEYKDPRQKPNDRRIKQTGTEANIRSDSSASGRYRKPQQTSEISKPYTANVSTSDRTKVSSATRRDYRN